MCEPSATADIVNKNGNDHILIGIFPSEIVKGSCRFHADCSLYYIVGNKLDLNIEFKVPSEPAGNELLFAFQTAAVTIKIPGKELITGNVKEFRDGLATIQPSKVRIRDENTHGLQLQSATFQLINFRFTGGNGQELSEVNGYRLDVGDWVIKITNIPAIKDKFKELARIDGYGITHNVELYKSDHSDFMISDLDKLMNVLHAGLSFANGGWISLHNLTGLSNNGEVVYQSWGVNLSESWQSRIIWLEKDDIKALEMFLNCFYNTYDDTELFDTIQKAIYWYIRSNRSSSGVDGGVILSVSALERLSNYIIESRSLQLGKSVRRLSVKVRLAAANLGIPLSIVDDSRLSKIRDYLEPSAKDNHESSDIPFTIVSIRNDLVHPKRNIDRAIFQEALFPAWNTAQWLIEMMVLAVVGYSGSYVNRQVLGGFSDVKLVPWLQNRLNV